jgi:uncharacterized protein HemY
MEGKLFLSLGLSGYPSKDKIDYPFGVLEVATFALVVFIVVSFIIVIFILGLTLVGLLGKAALLELSAVGS